MFGIFCYLVGPLVSTYIGKTAGAPYDVMSTIVPNLLVLFVWVVFEEEKKMPVWVLALVLASAGLVLLTYGYGNRLDNNSQISLILQIVKVALLVLAILIIWRGRDADLVTLRLKIRDYFVASILLTAAAIVGVELLTGFLVPINVEVFGMTIILVTCLVFNFFFVRLNPTAKLTEEPKPIATQSNDEMIQNLLRRMQDERLYADHDLRVAGLAETLRVPEYQLRKRINQQLGYRNFNQFVNRYRLEEAGKRLLADPSMPVLTIALDVGFRSISSFNTSFLGHYGQSPTQYRAEGNQ